MVIRLRLQKDVTTLNYLKKSVRNILVNVKINLTRSSKPTRGQAGLRFNSLLGGHATGVLREI